MADRRLDVCYLLLAFGILLGRGASESNEFVVVCANIYSSVEGALVPFGGTSFSSASKTATDMTILVAAYLLVQSAGWLGVRMEFADDTHTSEETGLLVQTTSTSAKRAQIATTVAANMPMFVDFIDAIPFLPSDLITFDVDDDTIGEKNGAASKLNADGDLDLARDWAKGDVQLSLINGGCGGVYSVYSVSESPLKSPRLSPPSPRPWGVLKPAREEAHAPGNPKAHGSSNASCDHDTFGGSLAVGSPHPLRHGLLVGSGAMREALAARLDRMHGGFARVPATILVDLPDDGNGPLASGGGVASLQRFVPHEASAEDFGSSLFVPKDVHSVGLLDCWLFNTDRHAGNMLLVKDDAVRDEGGGSGMRIIPIDHGLILPAITELGEANFEWLYWRQAKLPFNVTAREWVAKLDPVAAAAEALSIGLRPECAATLRATTVVLQRCVAAGMSLFDIGKMWQKDVAELQSALQGLVAAALAKVVTPADYSTAFDTHLAAATDMYLKNLGFPK